eukprot:jgi/Picre1/31437/NNA_006789.t1
MLGVVLTRDVPVTNNSEEVVTCDWKHAVEFGVIPVDLEANQNSLHKTVQKSRGGSSGALDSVPKSPLPVKVPVVRGTMVDLVARRGLVQIVLIYPRDAQEIKWNRDGHPVPAPYQGPSSLRFELEFPDTFDVKLAVTCWAKASFDVIHSGLYDQAQTEAEVKAEEDMVLDVKEDPMELDETIESESSSRNSLERSRSVPNAVCSGPRQTDGSKNDSMRESEDKSLPVS